MGCDQLCVAQRVCSRLASGERGPTADVIRQIDAELNRASQIDAILTNESSVEHFHRQVDALLQALELGAEHDASNASIMQRLQQLATGKSALIGDVVGAKASYRDQSMIKGAPEGLAGPLGVGRRGG